MSSTSWTTLGTIGGTRSARVDGAGQIVGADDAWSLAWSVGAEDRWHHPESTANVRQTLLDDAGVVETRMRVPGGDIVHRAYALHTAGPGGGSEWVVVEIENDSAVPVALALTRPPGTPLVLPRDPSDTRAGGNELVFTLTHRATLRVLLGLDAEFDAEFDAGSDAPAVDALPPLDAVRSGWRTQTDRGARIVLPDDRLAAALEATRVHLLVDASRSVSPVLARVLDELGLHGEARGVVARLVEFRFDRRRGGFGDVASNASVVAAVAHHQALAPDAEFARAVVEPVVAGVQQLLDAVRPRRFRSSPTPTADVLAALAAAPAFLLAAGQDEAASTVTDALSVALADGAAVAAVPAVDPIAVVDEMLTSAGPTWTWSTDDGRDRAPVASARFAAGVRRLVVDETASTVSLLGSVPRRWVGQPVEVHEVPTPFGRVSYAVRWHGERPALLWELDRDGAGDTTTPVTLRCGLDPSWSTTDASGETLLAAPEG